jgi:GTP-binding protein
VAIVGRPNVGKSLLFNRLAGQRLSIVEDTPGVTRDRLYAPCEWNGRQFDIVDTGGIEPAAENEILLFLREQAQIAIDAADVVVLVTEIGTRRHRRGPGSASSCCAPANPSFWRSTKWTPPGR